MPWGAVAGAAISGLANVFSAKSAQANAQDYNTYVLKHRHQWEVADLKKAGLNPILSATNSAGGAGIAASPAGSVPDLGSAVNSSKALKVQQQIANRNQDIEQGKLDLEKDKWKTGFELMKKQMENYDALTQKVIAEGEARRLENGYIPKLREADYGIKLATIGTVQAQGEMYKGQAAAGYATAQDHLSHVAVNNATVSQINASIDSIRAAIPKMIKDGEISGFKAEQLKIDLDLIKKHPDLYESAFIGVQLGDTVKPATDIVDSILGNMSKMKAAGKVPISNQHHTHTHNTTIYN